MFLLLYIQKVQPFSCIFKKCSLFSCIFKKCSLFSCVFKNAVAFNPVYSLQPIFLYIFVAFFPVFLGVAFNLVYCVAFITWTPKRVGPYCRSQFLTLFFFLCDYYKFGLIFYGSVFRYLGEVMYIAGKSVVFDMICKYRGVYLMRFTLCLLLGFLLLVFAFV